MSKNLRLSTDYKISTLTDLDVQHMEEAYQGRSVRKINDGKFKSGLPVNTVKSVIIHPILPDQLAFTFYEDDSYVECRRCRLIDR